MSGEVLPLRPHHGMCMAYFAGRGYSEEFTAHMAALLAALTAETPVCLTVGCDEVCRACPNNRGGVCDAAEKTARYDRAVLALCGLREGDELAFGRFTALVGERILAAGRRRGVCGDCQWDEICGGAAGPPYK